MLDSAGLAVSPLSTLYAKLTFAGCGLIDTVDTPGEKANTSISQNVKQAEQQAQQTNLVCKLVWAEPRVTRSLNELFVSVEAVVCKWASIHETSFKNRSQTEPKGAACEKTKQRKEGDKNVGTIWPMKRRAETEQEQTEKVAHPGQEIQKQGKRRWKRVKRVPEEGRVGEQRRGNHGRLVARPLMARTRRGRHGVRPGT